MPPQTRFFEEARLFWNQALMVFVSLAKDEEGDEERKKERIHSKTICQCGALLERWMFIAVEEGVEGGELVRRVPMSWFLVLRRGGLQAGMEIVDCGELGLRCPGVEGGRHFFGGEGGMRKDF